MGSVVPRHVFKFEHIVFYERTHTGGAIRRLSAVPSNDSKCKDLAGCDVALRFSSGVRPAL